MSKATKRKHVFNEILLEDFAPIPANQLLVKVVSSRGNNLHEVESPDSTVFLVSMPSKFRKNVWIKRGDYIIVEPIEEGDKVKAEMVKPVTAEYMKYLKSENLWPEQFDEAKSEEESSDEDEFVNPNRRNLEDSTTSDDESDRGSTDETGTAS